jgi:aryl-alcohol dehydrogenase-like predicted oxidoreductase
MRFHRKDWRRRVFRDDLLQQTVRRVAMVKALVDTPFSLAQFALRFCLSHPAIAAVIPGIREKSHARCNFMVLEQDALSSEMLNQITTLWKEELCFHVRTSRGEEAEGERRLAARRE